MAHKLTALQTQRAAAGHTLDSLSKKADVHPIWISRAEAGGDIDVVASNRIAAALAVSLATLGKVDV